MLEIISMASKMNIEIKRGEIFGKYLLSSDIKNTNKTKIISTRERKNITLGYSMIDIPKGPNTRGVKAVKAKHILIDLTRAFFIASICMFIMILNYFI